MSHNGTLYIVYMWIHLLVLSLLPCMPKVNNKTARVFATQILNQSMCTDIAGEHMCIPTPVSPHRTIVYSADYFVVVIFLLTHAETMISLEFCAQKLNGLTKKN